MFVPDEVDGSNPNGFIGKRIRTAKNFFYICNIYTHLCTYIIYVWINNSRIFGKIFLLLKQKGINGTCDCSLSRAVIVTTRVKLSSPVMLASLQITDASNKVLL